MNIKHFGVLTHEQFAEKPRISALLSFEGPGFLPKVRASKLLGQHIVASRVASEDHIFDGLHDRRSENSCVGKWLSARYAPQKKQIEIARLEVDWAAGTAR